MTTCVFGSQLVCVVGVVKRRIVALTMNVGTRRESIVDPAVCTPYRWREKGKGEIGERGIRNGKFVQLLKG